ncbi:MAG: hypothetical protein RBU27_12475 [Bacteroidota bacterium]|nr:hypothetical protein [Bacteroidota bacterium]
MPCLAPVLHAQPVVEWREFQWRESFSTTPTHPYHLGSASRLDPVLGNAVLTPPEESRAGRLFLRRLLPIDRFDLSFRGWFGGSTNENGTGADGIVFVFAPLFDFPENGGGTLNFDGCLGYGVEFDTYHNADRGDRSPEHVALIKDESANHLVSELLTPGTLENDSWHDLRVRFRAGFVEVFIDGVRRLDHRIADFTAYEGFFGFTSATGFAWNEHRIDDVALSLPARVVTDFGVVNICDVAAIDTVVHIRNNHPDATALEILSATITGANPDVFAIVGNPLPAIIAPDADLPIPLRITLPGAGTFSAVLTLEATNGERIHDTLRIAAEESRLAWRPTEAVFPVTPAAATSFVTMALDNIGRVPATISDARWSVASAGLFSTTLPLPVTLAPGASLAVSLAYAPVAHGAHADTLVLHTSCGAIDPLPLRGVCEDGGYVFHLGTPMVLSPGETDLLTITLDTLPARWIADAIAFTFRYDTAFVRVDGVELLPDGPARDATLTPPRIEHGIASFTLIDAGGMVTPGAIARLRLTAVANGPDCRAARLDWRVFTPLPATGSTEGDICINPSCRHPDGLVRAGIPRFQVSPQPAHTTLRIVIEADVAVTASVRLYDAHGREVAAIFDGVLAEGGATVHLPVANLARGYYTLLLRSALGDRAHPVILE